MHRSIFCLPSSVTALLQIGKTALVCLLLSCSKGCQDQSTVATRLMSSYEAKTIAQAGAAFAARGAQPLKRPAMPSCCTILVAVSAMPCICSTGAMAKESALGSLRERCHSSAKMAVKRDRGRGSWVGPRRSGDGQNLVINGDVDRARLVGWRRPDRRPEGQTD